MASGMNQRGIIEPDKTFIKTFLIVMIAQTFKSQNENIWNKKLRLHKTP